MGDRVARTGDPPSDERSRTRSNERRSNRSQQPLYVTEEEDIDENIIVKPGDMSQACWTWRKARGSHDTFYKNYYWYNNYMSPRSLFVHQPPCPGRAVSPPRSLSPSPTHPRTIVRELASSSARIAEPLDPDVAQAKPAPPRPPPPPPARPDACIPYRPSGETPSPERWCGSNADTIAVNAPETTPKSGQPRPTDLAASGERVVKRARNDIPDVQGAARRMFYPTVNFPKAPSVVPQMRPPAWPNTDTPAAAVAVALVKTKPVMPVTHAMRAARALDQIRAKPIIPVSHGVSSTEEAAPETNRAAIRRPPDPPSHMPRSAGPTIAPDDREGFEVHYPPWARKMLDELQDGTIPPARGPELDDPEDQCELASPTPRLLTAGGYNRQH